MTEGTLVLTARDVVDLLPIDECIDAVEQAFRLHSEGRAIQPAVLGVHVDAGGFHIKAAGLPIGRRTYFAVKVNANFPANRERFGLPTIQGMIALFDVENGAPLAVIESAQLTSMRTAAATAVAARYLSRADSTIVTICGCGVQSRDQLRALVCVRPIRSVFAFDVDAERALDYARTMSSELGIDVQRAPNLAQATRESDICITCTTSQRAIVHVGDVRAGAFVAAVGADNPMKQEIDPALLATSTVVVDVLEQCATIGDLHHALAAGVMTRADVRAELGDVVTGRRLGRLSDAEIVVFDSTGTALQDVAASAVIYERAAASGREGSGF